MLKAVNFYFLLAIYTALLFITNSAIINHQSIVVVTQCQSNQKYFQGKGCTKICSKQLRQQCKDIFADGWFEGTVCGKTNNGWVNFGSNCQACLQVKIQNYANGNCQERSEIDVGKPIQNLPNWSDQLPGIPICKNNFIYTKQRGCIKACSHPDYKKCGNLFVTLFDPKFCALKKDGTWKSFTFECQACTNKYPLTEYLGVSVGECSVELLKKSVDGCKTDSNCKSDQRCTFGSCINKCSGILCKAGTTCSNGSCLVNDQCIKDSDCSINQLCNSGKCILKTFKCGNSLCKINDKCIFGQCVKSSPSPSVVQPIIIDKCANKKCGNGFICKQGLCISNGCSQCKPPQICNLDGKCV